MNKKSCVVVTGGSSGLGLAMAEQLAKEGKNIVILGRDPNKLEQALCSLKNINTTSIAIATDITKQESLTNAFQQIQQTFSKIDFLILNAGVVHVGSLAEINTKELKQDIDIDLWGTILSTKEFLPLLEQNSKVLIVSSALGLLGVAGYPGYCAAKAGLINFAAVLRRELLSKKINVFVACPADIQTPQYEYEFNSMPTWMRSNKTSRPPAMSAAIAANKILNKCYGKNFLIIINFEIKFLLLLNKILPCRIVDYILDQMFPRP